MKEYKRLTDTYSEDRCYYNQMDFINVDEMYDRLAELEDKIEQGLLVELHKPHIRHLGRGILADGYVICKPKIEIVSDVLTKEEAETKLAELRGGE